MTSFRRGVTVIELLIAGFLITILMLAAFLLLKSSWQSYDNLVWQTKVNMEARQALDDICDLIRMGGNDVDMIRPAIMYQGQVNPDASSNQQLRFLPIGYVVEQTYYAKQSNRDNIYYIVRKSGNSANPTFNRKVGQFLRTVQFEYEYRLPSTNDADPVWRFRRVSNPIAEPTAAYLATTIYVTVTAEVQPYPNGTVYRRVLTGATSLRGPHGMVMPPAVYNNVPQLPDPDA
jgi:hypothetical protein